MKRRHLAVLLCFIVLFVGALAAALGTRVIGGRAHAAEAHASGTGANPKPTPNRSPHVGHEEVAGGASASPARVWDSLVEGNRRFVAGEREGRDLKDGAVVVLDLEDEVSLVVANRADLAGVDLLPVHRTSPYSEAV